MLRSALASQRAFVLQGLSSRGGCRAFSSLDPHLAVQTKQDEDEQTFVAVNTSDDLDQDSSLPAQRLELTGSSKLTNNSLSMDLRQTSRREQKPVSSFSLRSQAGRVSCFPSSSRFGSLTPQVRACVTTPRLFSSIPEPGACPECGDENTYWDGGNLFICTSCEHEWTVVDDGDEKHDQDDPTEDSTKDANGNVLQQGDTCILTQDLAKGKLKKGLKVKIRLGDYGDGHDCEATIKGVGTYALKSQFLKKA